MADKYKTTFLIRAEKKPTSITELLANLFYKSPSLSDHALSLLKEIKKGTFETRHWKQFCLTEFKDCQDKTGKIKLTRAKTKYYSIIRKLRGSGMVYSRDGLYRLSDHFEAYLEWSADMMKNWKKD